jgi:phenylalanyl-tRNA synthetase beta chain
MPVVTVKRSDLYALLGRSLGEDELYYYLAKLKCEVEEIREDLLSYEANSDRPDLFSVEGLSRALKPWLGIPWRGFSIVDSDVRGYAGSIPERPYVALAVVRDLELSDEALSQIMQLQEKIAQTYGRARRKISIGVYDLDKVKPPIYYEAVNPDEVEMTPLNETVRMKLRDVLSRTEKGILYGYIIQHMDKYPVLRDSEGRILSLVPIINSEDCRVRQETRSVLIDATGTSLEDVVNAVTLMATSIVERSTSGFIEAVRVVYENGFVVEAPRRRTISIEVSVEDINKLLGTALSSQDIVNLLKYSQYEVDSVMETKLIVKPPIYRIDVKTWVDVAEDVAVAYGYETLGSTAQSLPPSTTPGKKHPVEYFSSRIRDLLVGMGFQEVANYMMSSRDIQLGLMGVEGDLFVVGNPKSDRFEALRIWLTPQLIEVVRENAEKYSKLLLFEIGDVVIPDSLSETRARIERRVGLAITHEKATLTDGVAYVKALLRELGLNPVFEKKAIRGFLEERTAGIKACGEELGFVGEVDPRILYSQGLKNPLVISEITLSKIIKLCLK